MANVRARAWSPLTESRVEVGNQPRVERPCERAGPRPLSRKRQEALSQASAHASSPSGWGPWRRPIGCTRRRSTGQLTESGVNDVRQNGWPAGSSSTRQRVSRCSGRVAPSATPRSAAASRSSAERSRCTIDVPGHSGGGNPRSVEPPAPLRALPPRRSSPSPTTGGHRAAPGRSRRAVAGRDSPTRWPPALPGGSRSQRNPRAKHDHVRPWNAGIVAGVWPCRSRALASGRSDARSTSGSAWGWRAIVMMPANSGPSG